MVGECVWWVSVVWWVSMVVVVTRVSMSVFPDRCSSIHTRTHIFSHSLTHTLTHTHSHTQAIFVCSLGLLALAFMLCFNVSVMDMGVSE